MKNRADTKENIFKEFLDNQKMSIFVAVIINIIYGASQFYKFRSKYDVVGFDIR